MILIDIDRQTCSRDGICVAVCPLKLIGLQVAYVAMGGWLSCISLTGALISVVLRMLNKPVTGNEWKMGPGFGNSKKFFIQNICAFARDESSA